MLAKHFLKTLSEQENKIFIGLHETAETLIANYTWPGNVRQLENAIHSSIVMSDGPLLSQEALRFSLNLSNDALRALQAIKPTTTRWPTTAELPANAHTKNLMPLASIERLTIERAINLFNGNVVEAAAALGVSPSTLYRKIQVWQN